jgi:hypothetical protein
MVTALPSINEDYYRGRFGNSDIDADKNCFFNVKIFSGLIASKPQNAMKIEVRGNLTDQFHLDVLPRNYPLG